MFRIKTIISSKFTCFFVMELKELLTICFEFNGAWNHTQYANARKTMKLTQKFKNPLSKNLSNPDPIENSKKCMFFLKIIFFLITRHHIFHAISTH